MYHIYIYIYAVGYKGRSKSFTDDNAQNHANEHKSICEALSVDSFLFKLFPLPCIFCGRNSLCPTRALSLPLPLWRWSTPSTRYHIISQGIWGGLHHRRRINVAVTTAAPARQAKEFVCALLCSVFFSGHISPTF